jgi:hypothetical protein
MKFSVSRPQPFVENLWKTLAGFGKLSHGRFFHRDSQSLRQPYCGKVENFSQVLQIKDLPTLRRETACGNVYCPFWRKPLYLSANSVNQLTNLVVENAVGLCQAVDLVNRVHNGRVMLAAKLASYLGKAVFRQPFAKIHSNLPRR